MKPVVPGPGSAGRSQAAPAPAYQDQTLLTAIADLFDQAFVTTDAQGVVTRWNRGAQAIFGASAAAATGHSLSKVWDEALLAGIDQAILATPGPTSSFRSLWTMARRADGEVIPIEVDVIEFLESPDSEPGRAYIVRDRSAEVDAEAALSHLGTQRALLSRAVRSAPVAVLGYDAAGVITLAQGGALPAGRGALGTSVFDLFRDRPRTVGHLRDALTGTSVDDVIYYEGQILRAAHRPLRDESGEVVGATLTGFDVTLEVQARDRSRRDVSARRAAQGARVEAERRYRRVVRNAPIAILVLDDEDRVAVANPRLAELLGRDLNALVGLPFTELGLPEPTDTEPPAAQPFQRSGSSAAWLEVSTTKVSPELGYRPERVVWIRDVTGRVALQGRVSAAERMEAVGSFAGGVVHDFNNVLGVIRGYADLLGESVPREGIMRQDLQGITEAVDRAVSIVQELLAFARDQTLEPRVVLLNGQLGYLMKFLKPLIPDEVSLTFVECEGSTPVFVDPVQLERVTVNLVLNARDAISGAGHVRVETHLADDPATGPRVIFTVTDDGVGMAPEVAKRCFEPFYTTKQPGVGTGLGLSTAYGIVKQSRGTLDVASSLGNGSTFTVDLPRAREAVRESEADVPNEVLSPANRLTVLVVDDDDEIRGLAVRLMARAGYEVLEASGVATATALARATTGPIDLLLTDLQLDDGDGVELGMLLVSAGLVRTFLVMTGLPPTHLSEQVRILAKPFSANELLRHARETIERG